MIKIRHKLHAYKVECKEFTTVALRLLTEKQWRCKIACVIVNLVRTQVFWKINISYPLIRTRTYTDTHSKLNFDKHISKQGVRNVRFSGKSYVRTKWMISAYNFQIGLNSLNHFVTMSLFIGKMGLWVLPGLKRGPFLAQYMVEGIKN